MAQDKPRFIRRNGRIIPIGPKKGPNASKAPKVGPKKPGNKSSESATKKGLAFVAAGIGTAALASFGAGKLVRKAAAIGKTSINTTKTAKFAFGSAGHVSQLGNKVGEILLKGAARRARATNTVLKFSQGLNGLGKLVGGVLIVEGVAKLVEGQKGKQLSIKEDLAAQALGWGALGAGTYSFKKGVGNKLLRKILSKGKL